LYFDVIVLEEEEDGVEGFAVNFSYIYDRLADMGEGNVTKLG
jgi:hypothetical protein